jgi:hypothetical protein
MDWTIAQPSASLAFNRQPRAVQRLNVSGLGSTLEPWFKIESGSARKGGEKKIPYPKRLKNGRLWKKTLLFFT